MQENLLSSGGFNGTLIYWVGANNTPHTTIHNAHNYSINVIAWHPLGHCVATGSNDATVKFWSREPPGSKLTLDVGEWMETKIDHGPSLVEIEAVSYAPTAPSTAGGGRDHNEGGSERFAGSNVKDERYDNRKGGRDRDGGGAGGSYKDRDREKESNPSNNNNKNNSTSYYGGGGGNTNTNTYGNGNGNGLGGGSNYHGVGGAGGGHDSASGAGSASEHYSRGLPGNNIRKDDRSGTAMWGQPPRTHSQSHYGAGGVAGSTSVPSRSGRDEEDRKYGYNRSSDVQSDRDGARADGYGMYGRDGDVGGVKVEGRREKKSRFS